MVMRNTGGEGGVRTHDGLTFTAVFKYVQKKDPGLPGPWLANKLRVDRLLSPL